MRHTFIAFLLLFTFHALAADSAPTEKQWQVDGVTRKALLAIPAAATQPSPLVFVFHGHGGSAQNAAKTFALHNHWPQAIIVYPQGLPTPGIVRDLEGKKTGWQHNIGEQHDRDVRFFDAMLKTIREENKVDDQRIYATGFSNGGEFTYLLLDARGQLLAAVAPCATLYRDFEHLKPKPILHFAGQNDPLDPFATQQRLMRFDRSLNHCENEGHPWAKSGDVVGTLYPSPSRTPFVSLTFPGGHAIPTEAPALIVKFFKENPKK